MCSYQGTNKELDKESHATAQYMVQSSGIKELLQQQALLQILDNINGHTKLYYNFKFSSFYGLAHF